MIAEVPGTLARTGYTGELGYEFFFPREDGIHVWDAVMAAGAPFGMLPCGLGALRSVRMEKRYPLYGLDLNDKTSPIEANLGWTVRFDKGDFIGRDALLRQKENGVSRTLVAIEFPDLGFLPATGNDISIEGEPVGTVTSGDRGFAGKSIALGYVKPEFAVAGAAVIVAHAAGDQHPGVVNTKAACEPDRSIARLSQSNVNNRILWILCGPVRRSR